MPNAIGIISATPSLAIVSLPGEHDLGDHERLKIALARAAIRAPNVIVDLSNCAFVDSSVVALLLHTQRIVALGGGRFAAAFPAEPNAVTRVADLMQLDQLMPVYGSVQAALAALGQIDSTITTPA